MARVFITGSSDGQGRMAAQLLIEQKHSVATRPQQHERTGSSFRRAWSRKRGLWRS
jgi:NAD(P)-dependent dehydrogenase (short-subunit alcohol dehydrogenase family)